MRLENTRGVLHSVAVQLDVWRDNEEIEGAAEDMITVAHGKVRNTLHEIDEAMAALREMPDGWTPPPRKPRVPKTGDRVRLRARVVDTYKLAWGGDGELTTATVLELGEKQGRRFAVRGLGLIPAGAVVVVE
jgi:hypothetical protein